MSTVDKKSCKLVRNHDQQLDFDFQWGGCAVGGERMFLCFDLNSSRVCHYADGGLEWKNMTSLFSHKLTQIASSES